MRRKRFFLPDGESYRGAREATMSMDTEIEIIRWEGDAARACRDVVAQEEPLEILLNGESLAVTMRTPGNDFALTTGFLYAESLIRSAGDIQTIDYCGVPGDP